MSKKRTPRGRAKRGMNIRMTIDLKQDQLLAGMQALTEAVQSLTEKTTRLELQIWRSTERLAAMRRG